MLTANTNVYDCAVVLFCPDWLVGYFPEILFLPRLIVMMISNFHLKGIFFFTQKMLPVLNDNGGIVNISSGLTRFTLQGSGAYASIKSAVETLTK